MVQTDHERAEAVRQATVDRENQRNRGIIADAIKQFVLIVISLGFSNAFTILSRPLMGADGLSHLFTHQGCAACSLIKRESWLIFAIYTLIGARFLLTNWLYISTTYRDDNPKQLRIIPDAVGIFLTSIFIGIQSSYASADFMTDFFEIFCVILAVDVVSSFASIGMNRRQLIGDGLCQELLWVGNNLILGVASVGWILAYPPHDRTDRSVWPLMGLAFLNCAISFGITWYWYFRAGRAVWQR